MARGEGKCRHCQVILVGEPAAGKTSFQRALVGDEFVEDQDSTEGVNVTMTTTQLENDDVRVKPLLTEVPSDSMVTDIVTNCMIQQRKSRELAQQAKRKAVDPEPELTAGLAKKSRKDDQEPMTQAADVSVVHQGQTPHTLKPAQRLQTIKSQPSASKIAERLRKEPSLQRPPARTLAKIRRDLQDLDEESECTFVRVVDCGGQLSFSMAQSVCLNETDSVHVIAFNASLDLDKTKPKDLECFRHRGETVKVTNSLPISHIDYIMHWLSSITIVTTAGPKGKPDVILLGSHVDLIDDPDAAVQKIKVQLSRRITESKLHKKLSIHGPYFVDNCQISQSCPHSQMSEVQEKLRELITVKLPTTPVPLSWMKMEMIINRLRSTDARMQFNQFVSVVGCVIDDCSDTDVTALVKYLHKIRNCSLFPAWPSRCPRPKQRLGVSERWVAGRRNRQDSSRSTWRSRPA